MCQPSARSAIECDTRPNAISSTIITAVMPITMRCVVPRRRNQERNCAYAEKANDPNDAWSTSSKFSRIVSYFSLFSSSFPPSLVPKMKRVGEDDVAKKIVPGSIVEVESGIHLEIAGDVAGKADRR